MKTITRVTHWTKKRVNSKHWDLVTFETVEGMPDLVTTPRSRTTQTVITDIPDAVTIDEFSRYWGLVDMIMAPLFFSNSARLGCTWVELLDATSAKIEGKTEHASIGLQPLVMDITIKEVA